VPLIFYPCESDFMYTGYFGLSDLPFSIAPNPDYLFMSDRHREALAHLTYGLGDTGGFALLTGEVGTGKTTISRCLIAQLPENTQTAFILNPTLSSQELLATVCDQLKVRYRKTGATLKTLTDKIQEKLLKNHQANINTLLIIDEAQHLAAEVLEQLRLLTNYETNTKKLLQVVLIGQPELQQLLQRRDLRQLSQRITARYHLMPLNKAETKQYILHRLSVANCYRSIFDKSAVALIHQLSQGIPRLINLLCDRSLWIAYGENKSIVDKKTVIKSSLEALGEEYQALSFWTKTPVKIAATVAMLVGALGFGLWWGQHYANNTEQILDVKNINVKSLLQSNTEPKVATKKSSKQEDAQQTELPISAEQLVVASKKATHTVDIDKQNKQTPLNSKNQPQPLILGYKSDEYHQQLAAKNTKEQPLTYQVEATTGVSEKLLKSFQNAISETAKNEVSDDLSVPQNIETKPLSDMPSWLQESLPKMKFEMHIYASDGQGWVRVNGQDIHEGQHITAKLMLSKILPQQVILNFQGEQFSMPALSSW
jgi:general secretion pathway protein A